MATSSGSNNQMSEFTPRIDYKTNRSGPLRWVLSHLRRHWYFFTLVVFFTLTTSLLSSSVPQYIGQIFELYNNNNLSLVKLKELSIIILFLGLGAGLVNLLRNFSTEFISQRMERDTRDELYSSLLGKSLTFHDKQKIGDLMTRATQDVRQINFMMNPGFNLVFQSIVGIIIPIIFIGTINIELILVPVVYIIVFVFVLRRYNQAQAPYAMKSRRAASTTQSRLNETIQGMPVVRSSAQEDHERDLFHKNIVEYRDAQVKLGEIQAKYWPILLLGIATALGILHGVFLVQDNTITIGQLVEFILLFQLLRFPTFINIFAITVLTLGYAAAERILELLEGESNIDQNIEGYSDEIKGVIKYENVTFGYSEDNPILKDISFEIRPGQTVALVGMTGAGKTSLTKLLARLYDPQQGRITIDEVDLKDWAIAPLRSQMALVEQDIFLFSKSIKENILLGSPDATMEEVERAAKLAHAYDFIMESPDGFDTEIGERGTQLSGGQKQRIAIARAVIKDPRILILDDASSAIDSQTEDEINKAIRDVLKDRVSFLITHRIAQIRRADLIILLERGEIIDMGDHNYLIKNSDRYREIFSTYDGFEEKVALQQEEN